jgi:hypothetical protein
MKDAKQFLLGSILGLGMSTGLLSCLEEEQNSGTATAIGVISDETAGPMANTNFGFLYSTDFERYCKPGDCIFFRFAYNYAAPENKDYIKNGYLVVSLMEKPTIIPRAEINLTTADTMTFLEGEIPIVTANDPLSWNYVDRHLFLTSTLDATYLTVTTDNATYTIDPNDLQWLFYCDPQQEPDTDSNGNVYTAHLRIVVPADVPAHNSHLSTDLVAVRNAYPLHELLTLINEREQARKNIGFSIRLGYLTTITSLVPTWRYVTAITLRIL